MDLLKMTRFELLFTACMGSLLARDYLKLGTDRIESDATSDFYIDNLINISYKIADAAEKYLEEKNNGE